MGAHTLKYYSTDAAGNAEAEKRAGATGGQHVAGEDDQADAHPPEGDEITLGGTVLIYQELPAQAAQAAQRVSIEPPVCLR